MQWHAIFCFISQKNHVCHTIYVYFDSLFFHTTLYSFKFCCLFIANVEQTIQNKTKNLRFKYISTNCINNIFPLLIFNAIQKVPLWKISIHTWIQNYNLYFFDSIQFSQWYHLLVCIWHGTVQYISCTRVVIGPDDIFFFSL